MKETVRVEIIGPAGTGKMGIAMIISSALAAHGFDLRHTQGESALFDAGYSAGNLPEKVSVEIAIVQQSRQF